MAATSAYSSRYPVQSLVSVELTFDVLVGDEGEGVGKVNTHTKPNFCVSFVDISGCKEEDASSDKSFYFTQKLHKVFKPTKTPNTYKFTTFGRLVDIVDFLWQYHDVYLLVSSPEEGEASDYYLTLSLRFVIDTSAALLGNSYVGSTILGPGENGSKLEVQLKLKAFDDPRMGLTANELQEKGESLESKEFPHRLFTLQVAFPGSLIKEPSSIITEMKEVSEPIKSLIISCGAMRQFFDFTNLKLPVVCYFLLVLVDYWWEAEKYLRDLSVALSVCSHSDEHLSFTLEKEPLLRVVSVKATAEGFKFVQDPLQTEASQPVEGGRLTASYPGVEEGRNPPFYGSLGEHQPPLTTSEADFPSSNAVSCVLHAKSGSSEYRFPISICVRDILWEEGKPKLLYEDGGLLDKSRCVAPAYRSSSNDQSSSIHSSVTSPKSPETTSNGYVRTQNSLYKEGFSQFVASEGGSWVGSIYTYHSPAKPSSLINHPEVLKTSETLVSREALSRNPSSRFENFIERRQLVGSEETTKSLRVEHQPGGVMALDGDASLLGGDPSTARDALATELKVLDASSTPPRRSDAFLPYPTNDTFSPSTPHHTTRDASSTTSPSPTRDAPSFLHSASAYNQHELSAALQSPSRSDLTPQLLTMASSAPPGQVVSPLLASRESGSALPYSITSRLTSGYEEVLSLAGPNSREGLPKSTHSDTSHALAMEVETPLSFNAPPTPFLKSGKAAGCSSLPPLLSDSEAANSFPATTPPISLMISPNYPQTPLCTLSPRQESCPASLFPQEIHSSSPSKLKLQLRAWQVGGSTPAFIPSTPPHSSSNAPSHRTATCSIPPPTSAVSLGSPGEKEALKKTPLSPPITPSYTRSRQNLTLHSVDEVTNHPPPSYSGRSNSSTLLRRGEGGGKMVGLGGEDFTLSEENTTLDRIFRELNGLTPQFSHPERGPMGGVRMPSNPSARKTSQSASSYQAVGGVRISSNPSPQKTTQSASPSSYQEMVGVRMPSALSPQKTTQSASPPQEVGGMERPHTQFSLKAGNHLNLSGSSFREDEEAALDESKVMSSSFLERESEDWHIWRFSIDLLAIQFPFNLSQVYLKYKLGAFGAGNRPLITHPALNLRKYQIASIPNGFRSYTFSQSSAELRNMLSAAPLRIQIWSRDAYKEDQPIGYASIDLASVLNQPLYTPSSAAKEFLQSSPLVYRSLDGIYAIYFTSGISRPRSSSNGFIRLQLFLEDLGPSVGAKSPRSQRSAVEAASLTAVHKNVCVSRDILANRSVVATSAKELEEKDARPAAALQESMGMEDWIADEESQILTNLLKEESLMLQRVEERHIQLENERHKAYEEEKAHLMEIENFLGKKTLELEARSIELDKLKDKLERKRQNIKSIQQQNFEDYSSSVRRLKLEYEDILKIEKEKSRELANYKAETLKDLAFEKDKIDALEAENFELRRKANESPSYRMQTDLQLKNFQNEELKSKLEAMTSSRDHFLSNCGFLIEKIAEIKKESLYPPSNWQSDLSFRLEHLKSQIEALQSAALHSTKYSESNDEKEAARASPGRSGRGPSPSSPTFGVTTPHYPQENGNEMLGRHSRHISKNPSRTELVRNTPSLTKGTHTEALSTPWGGQPDLPSENEHHARVLEKEVTHLLSLGTYSENDKIIIKLRDRIRRFRLSEE